MKTFNIELRDTQGFKSINDVVSFVGNDASGSFGLWADHCHFITALTFGLARLRQQDGDWQYIAMPGGIVYFRDNVLRINTRRYFLGDNYGAMNQILEQTLLAEEQQLLQTKESLRRLEEGVLKRLWELQQRHGGVSPA